MAEQYNPVGWFEIPVTDMARAKAFYEHLFGYTIELHEMDGMTMAWFPMYMDAIGAAGSLVMADADTPPGHGTVVYFTAPDLEAHIARAAEKGGTVMMGKTDIGEYGFMALVKDTEGNTIGLHSQKG